MKKNREGNQGVREEERKLAAASIFFQSNTQAVQFPHTSFFSAGI
jgi:hypothetical protein